MKSYFLDRSSFCASLYSFLFIISFISCEQTSPPLPEITIKNGLIYKQGAMKPFTGIVKDTVEGKVIEYSVFEGKKSGEFKMYFKNGQLEMIGKLEENVNQGKWTYYYQSGQVESEGTFQNDLPNGIWRWYYENGNLKEEGIYLEGDREGRWVIYDIDGKIKEEKFFEKNQVQ